MNKKEKIVYYCDGMKFFGESMIKNLGYRVYNPQTDIDKEVFFEGLYFEQDYAIFEKHKGGGIVYWNGSDAIRLTKNPKWIEIVKAKKVRHLCQSKITTDILLSVGITSEHYPIFFGDIDKYDICYKHSTTPQVFMNAHPGREAEYGVDIIEGIAPRLPDVKFHIYGTERKTENPNVIYHGWVDEKIMDEEIKEYQCVIKGAYDGVSQTMSKAGFMGLYAITLGGNDFARSAKTQDEIVNLINDVRKQEQPNLGFRNSLLQFYRMTGRSYDPKISVSMIVKDEEVMIEEALKTVCDFDELVIVDTGSTDKTIEICKKYTDKVYTDYKWEDDFSKARNVSKSRCTGDWILIVDADETLDSTVEEVRSSVKLAEKMGAHFIDTNVNSKGAVDTGKNQRIFKNIPEIQWYAKAHNYLGDTTRPVRPVYTSEVTVSFGYSPAHKKDPERTFRILRKAVDENPELVRERYYLAREYYYKNKHKKCISELKKYFKKANWPPEVAEAYNMMANCYWIIGGAENAEKARNACVMAIKFNPDWHEPFELLSEMYHSPRKEVWIKHAQICQDNGVLFVRKRKYPVDDKV
jgi:glycosyltransferase involved in cell wall biosynthesis